MTNQGEMGGMGGREEAAAGTALARSLVHCDDDNEDKVTLHSSDGTKEISSS